MRRRTQGTGALALIGLATLLAALAVMFSNASSTQQAVDDARAAHLSETALGSVAVTRATVGQALLVASNTPDSTILPLLIDDARTVSAQLAIRIDQAGAALADIGVDTSTQLDGPSLAARSGAVLDLIEAGDLIAADAEAELLAADLAAADETLIGERDRLVGAVASAGTQAGKVATAARFMVALAVPGISLLSWASLARRRRKRQQMAAELEREREIGRSKNQMIANISHELRTPLTGIYAAARTMADMDYRDIEITRELNGVIVEQSTELKRMVEDLLVSAQADAHRLTFSMQEIDTTEACRNIVDEFARAGTTVSMDCEPATVAADPLRLRQILRNLVSNARDHGGPHIRIEGAPDGPGYRIVVADDGDGVPDEIEDHLFTPFVHRGDRPLITGSVGLGLSITRLLAEGMGGSIEYHHEDGTTRFVVSLNGPPEDPSPTESNEKVSDEFAEETHAAES